jgi:general secretion pathway protein C
MTEVRNVVAAKDQLIQSALHAAPSVANVVLIILVGLVLADLAWRGVLKVVPPPEATAPKIRHLDAQRNTLSEQELGNKIARLHLFGHAEEPELAPVVLEDAPDTRLNLTLRGVLAADESESLAIIAAGGNNERFYHVGDGVSGNAVITAIYPDRVMLLRDGQHEALRLPKSKGASASGLSRTSTSRPSRMIQPRSGIDLGKLREQMLKNPSRLSRLVRAIPKTNQGGQFLGYELSPRGSTVLFHQVGFQRGDIVTAVNGTTLDKPEKGLAALQKLINATDVTVTVLRDGSEVTIHHTIQ